MTAQEILSRLGDLRYQLHKKEMAAAWDTDSAYVQDRPLEREAAARVAYAEAVRLVMALELEIWRSLKNDNKAKNASTGQ